MQRALPSRSEGPCRDAGGLRWVRHGPATASAPGKEPWLPRLASAHLALRLRAPCHWPALHLALIFHHSRSVSSLAGSCGFMVGLSHMVVVALPLTRRIAHRNLCHDTRLDLFHHRLFASSQSTVPLARSPGPNTTLYTLALVTNRLPTHSEPNPWPDSLGVDTASPPTVAHPHSLAFRHHPSSPSS